MANIPEPGNEIDFSTLKSFSYEIGPIRPPSEGGSFSLLLRVTGNCPWSRCTFCYGRFYHREKFRLRPVEEVKADIDAVKGIADELAAISWKLGHGGDLLKGRRQTVLHQVVQLASLLGGDTLGLLDGLLQIFELFGGHGHSPSSGYFKGYSPATFGYSPTISRATDRTLSASSFILDRVGKLKR